MLEDNLFIAGRSGSGKSYFFQHTILPQLLADGRQIIIIDMKGEYNIGARVSIDMITDIRVMAEIATGRYTQSSKGDWIPPKIIVIDAHRYKVEQIDLIFQYLNYSVDKILVFEESAFFFGAPKIKTGYLPEETDVFLRCGTNTHNRNHNIVMLTQYPNDIPKKVLNVASKGYLFYLPMNALQYLYEKQFVEEKPEIVHDAIKPFRSYRYYEVN